MIQDPSKSPGKVDDYLVRCVQQAAAVLALTSMGAAAPEQGRSAIGMNHGSVEVAA